MSQYDNIGFRHIMEAGVWSTHLYHDSDYFATAQTTCALCTTKPMHYYRWYSYGVHWGVDIARFVNWLICPIDGPIYWASVCRGFYECAFTPGVYCGL